MAPPSPQLKIAEGDHQRPKPLTSDYSNDRVMAARGARSDAREADRVKALTDRKDYLRKYTAKKSRSSGVR